MEMPTASALKALQKCGDGEADPMLVELQQAHGVGALADLLKSMFKWMPPADFPPPGAAAPQPVIDAARAFLYKEGIFEGAIAGGVRWERVKQAQEFYKRHHDLGQLILGCGSLPACYSIPGVAQVLMGSGKLSTQVNMRLKETSRFLTEVMEPGSLGAGKDFAGNLWIRKVRLMHGLMRRLMLADREMFKHLTDDSPTTFLLQFDWAGKSTADDFPIDQVELGFVLLTFSWVVVRGLRSMWIGMDEDEADDHIYTWAVIGHALGIQPSLRPETGKDAEALFTLISDTYEEGTEDGRLLVAALVVYIILRLRQGVREMLPPWLLEFLLAHFKRFGSGCLESLARTFVRGLTGKDTANRLWVPRAPFLHWAAGAVVRLAILAKDKLTPGEERRGLSQRLGAQVAAHARSR
jgi:hypothetical protein